MIKTKNISEMLTSLNEEYRFNKNTLSKYLEITEETIDGVVTVSYTHLDRHLQKLQKPQILHGELVNQYRLAHWMVLQESLLRVAGSQ